MSQFDFAEFTESVRRLVPIPAFVQEGEVVAVADGSCTVKVDGLETPVSGIRYISKNESGVHWLKPAKGARVIMVGVRGAVTMYFIVYANKLDEVYFEVGESSFLMQDGIIEFNKGELKGLVKAEALVSKLNSQEQEISSLKARLTAFETVFNAHTHVAISLAAPTAVAVPPTVIGDAVPMLQTSLNDIENDKIKQ